MPETKKHSNAFMKKWPLILIPIGVTIVILILVITLQDGEQFSKSPSVGSNNPINASSTANTVSAISATFGSTFSYLGMEYTIGDYWTPGSWNSYIIPITVKNISNESHKPSESTRAWSPNGTSVSAYIKGVSQMLPDISQRTELVVVADGEGIYIVELYDFQEQVLLGKALDEPRIDVVITLPISSQQTSSSSSSPSTSPRADTANQNAGEVLYNGTPLSRILGNNIYDVIELLDFRLNDENFYRYDSNSGAYMPDNNFRLPINSLYFEYDVVVGVYFQSVDGEMFFAPAKK